ncbi:MAG: hypothetical protein AB7S26_12815 [Sandaracinaceae bacterium]
MRHLRLALALAVPSVLWLGCLYSPYGSSGGGGDVASTGSYVVEDGWLSGELPTVGEFDGAAYEIDATDYSVTLHAGSRGGEFDGWAMNRVSLDLDQIMLTSATVDEPATMSNVDVTGCTGPQHDDWDWDTHTSTTTVTVTPSTVVEGARVVTFQADFGDGDVSQGGFTVLPE